MSEKVEGINRFCSCSVCNSDVPPVSKGCPSQSPVCGACGPILALASIIRMRVRLRLCCLMRSRRWVHQSLMTSCWCPRCGACATIQISGLPPRCSATMMISGSSCNTVASVLLKVSPFPVSMSVVDTHNSTPPCPCRALPTYLT